MSVSGRDIEHKSDQRGDSPIASGRVSQLRDQWRTRSDSALAESLQREEISAHLGGNRTRHHQIRDDFSTALKEQTKERNAASPASSPKPGGPPKRSVFSTSGISLPHNEINREHLLANRTQRQEDDHIKGFPGKERSTVSHSHGIVGDMKSTQPASSLDDDDDVFATLQSICNDNINDKPPKRKYLYYYQDI